MLKAPSIEKSLAESSCAIDPETELAASSWPCKAVGFSVLGSIADKKYYGGWYQRSGKSGEGAEVTTEQLVIYTQEAAEPGLLPVWTDVVEVTEAYGQPVSGMEVIHGPIGDILAVEYFSGGTAGSWKEFFRIANGEKWQYLKESLDEDAAKCLKKGYGIQSRRIDLQRMEADFFSPNDDDPHCCPSGKIQMKVKLVGDTLKGEKCQFSKKTD